MGEPAPALWTTEQHGWLAALGYSVYMQGSLPEAAAQPQPQRGNPAAPAPRPAPPAARPARERSAPPPSPVQAQSADTPQPRARGLRPRIPQPLEIALIRAAKIKPDAPGMAEVIAAWPPAAQLRNDPAAKRALWPQLRALRKAARS